MKSEKEIRERLKEMEEFEKIALAEGDRNAWNEFRTIIKHLRWVLEDKKEEK